MRRPYGCNPLGCRPFVCFVFPLLRGVVVGISPHVLKELFLFPSGALLWTSLSFFLLNVRLTGIVNRFQVLYEFKSSIKRGQVRIDLAVGPGYMTVTNDFARAPGDSVPNRKLSSPYYRWLATVPAVFMMVVLVEALIDFNIIEIYSRFERLVRFPSPNELPGFGCG